MSIGHDLVCLLPVRNGAGYLTDYLGSARGFCDAIVALDDGSTDETRAILEASPLVQILLANPPRESYRGWDDGANRNRLLAAAAELEPRWIVSIDADERMDPDDARVLREFIRTDALPGCAYGFQHFRMWDAGTFDPDYRWTYRLFAHAPGQTFPNERLYFDPIPASIARTEWLRTTIRMKHVATETEERRRAWITKYVEADPRGLEHFGAFGVRPEVQLPLWEPRPPGLPVLVGLPDGSSARRSGQVGVSQRSSRFLAGSPVRGSRRFLPRLPGLDAFRVRRALRRRLRAGADTHIVGTAPLLPDYLDVEPIFADSERNLESILRPFRREFRWPLQRVYNLWFESVDAELYYSMVRLHRPDLIVEVGSGHSTGFAMEAIEKNGAGRIVSIDPHPRTTLPDGVEFIRRRVEDVDTSLFGELRKGDILFLDSSHTTAEARYHVGRIFPLLQKGVLCHHHDVCFPWADYMGDRDRFGEPDVVLDFYRKNPDAYRIEVSASYVRFRNPSLLTRLVPSYRPYPERIPTSFWARKIR